MTTTFAEYLEATKSTVSVMDALKYLADCHPVWRDNIILQNITNGKVNPTASDITHITQAGLNHAITISKKSLKLSTNQQVQISAEVMMLTSAVDILNSVRLQIIQETLASLSDVAIIRRFAEGQII